MPVLSPANIPTPEFISQRGPYQQDKETKTSPWICCLDYDGNLTPIVQSPELAILTEEQAEFLKALQDDPSIVWAIVTGRSVEQMEGFFKPFSLQPDAICGLHGGEVYLPQPNHWLRRPSNDLMALSDQFMDDVHAGLKQLFSTDDITSVGLALEPKKYSFALHYRAVTDDAIGKQAHQLFDDLFIKNPRISQAFRVQPGKRVVEIVPATFNKGEGIRFLMDNLPVISGTKHKQINSHAVTFMGDDKTDEPGFEVVNELGGVSVRVALPAHETTQATYQVSDVDDVYELLKRWVASHQTL